MGVYHDKNTLSQNFINNPNLVRELLDCTNISSEDTVLEIGPGKGIISEQLKDVVKHLVAIEKDPNLASRLANQFKEEKNVKIVNCDILDFHLPFTDYKVFSNIPFSITADIVTRFIKSPTQPSAMYFIMQEEAAEKFIGFPYETQSSILTKPWYEIKVLGRIDRTNFTPKPQVNIVFVSFIKRDQSFIKSEDKQEFRDFVIYGFNQWKPTIIDSYKKIFSYNQLKMVKKTFKLADLKPSEVSFDSWLGLFKTYRNVVSEEKKNLVHGFERSYRQKIKV